MKILDHIQGLASSYTGITKTVLSIIKLETRLAGLTIYPLILNICMLLIVLMTVWVSIMALIGYFVAMALGSTLIAIGGILSINMVLLVILLFYLKYNLKNMSFEKTRAYFSAMGKNEHDKLTQTSNSPAQHTRRRVKRASTSNC